MFLKSQVITPTPYEVMIKNLIVLRLNRQRLCQCERTGSRYWTNLRCLSLFSHFSIIVYSFPRFGSTRILITAISYCRGGRCMIKKLKSYDTTSNDYYYMRTEQSDFRWVELPWTVPCECRLCFGLLEIRAQVWCGTIDAQAHMCQPNVQCNLENIHGHIRYTVLVHGPCQS